eukprot:TRINITY_DN1114_c0_g1_i2.p1 TRINITY_DN1114_c0_g1~~TRINITY_DN1114_c0_g1_i2.p1  ORF type:complete len:348 (+),score=80.73 TRINITY_DN1114_c0_g1_i2:1070-2113(+)
MNFIVSLDMMKGDKNAAYNNIALLEKRLNEIRLESQDDWNNNEIGEMVFAQNEVEILFFEFHYCYEDYYSAEEDLGKLKFFNPNVNRKTYSQMIMCYTKLGFGKSKEMKELLQKDILLCMEGLEKQLEILDPSSLKLFGLDDILGQFLLCSNIRSLYGDDKKAIEHIRNAKLFGEKSKTVYIDFQHSSFFSLKTHTLFKDANDPKFGNLVLNVDICHKSLDKKSTFLNEGDLIKFVCVPFSRIDMLCKSYDELSELSKSDSSITIFQSAVSKVNTVFSSNFSDRSLKFEQKIQLFDSQTTYVIKSLAFQGGEILYVNFVISELVEFPTQFVDYLKSYDFESRLKKLL